MEQGGKSGQIQLPSVTFCGWSQKSPLVHRGALGVENMRSTAKVMLEKDGDESDQKLAKAHSGTYGVTMTGAKKKMYFSTTIVSVKSASSTVLSGGGPSFLHGILNLMTVSLL